MRAIQLEHLYGCRALWLAVIYRALCDASYQCFDQYQLNKHASLGSQFISRETSLLAHQARQTQSQRTPTSCHLIKTACQLI
jgi:hypothetical protein